MRRHRHARRRSRRAILAALFIGVIFAASVGFAAWTTSGTGEGYTKAETAQVLTTVDVSVDTVAQLYPGGTSDVILRIQNPNAYDVEVTAIDGYGTITSDQGLACDASTGVSFANQIGSWTVPGGGNLDVILPDAASMTNASDDSCQGAVFTIPVRLTGASA